MSSDEQLDSRGLKRAFLKKAISQGRGPEAIAHLRVLVQLRPDDQAARTELARLQALARP